MMQEWRKRAAMYIRMRRVFLALCFNAVLVVVAVWVWSVPTAQGGAGVLRVAFLDVGQGDAIFIEAPNGRQMLIDGGKGAAVLSELGSMMAYGDRSIDVVLATHPDLDHIGGLPEVFARYDIGAFIEPGVADDGADYAALMAAITEEGLEPLYARAGTQVELAPGVVFEVLFPDRDAHAMEPNQGSIVGRLTYGDTSLLFTGDSPTTIENYLTTRYGGALKSDVLKLGHHGSRTSTSEVWVGFVDPKYAIVSAGCDNQYGHPHQEVLDRLAQHEVSVLSTCEEGTVVFESDSLSLTVK